MLETNLAVPPVMPSEIWAARANADIGDPEHKLRKRGALRVLCWSAEVHACPHMFIGQPLDTNCRRFVKLLLSLAPADNCTRHADHTVLKNRQTEQQHYPERTGIRLRLER
jgi:hypothetical protein